MVKRIRENIEARELTPDSENANKGTEHGAYLLRRSLEDTGPGKAPVVDAAGNVIAGNKTVEMAVELGIPITLVQTYGEELVVHQRLDLDLADPFGKARRLAYLDNKTSEENLEWDMEQIAAHHEGGLDMTEFFGRAELAEMGIEVMDDIDESGVAPNSMAAASDNLEPHATTRVESGQVYQCGNHTLTVGAETKAGDAEVMIRAWEKYTGQRAELLDVEDGMF